MIKFEGSKHFKPQELASPDTGEAYVDPKLIEMLEELRERVGFPLYVTSGYRTPEWNEVVGGKKNSYHIKGKAVDLSVSFERAYDVIREAINVGFNGIGIQQKLGSDPNKRFIHLDIRPKVARTVWSY